MAELINSEVEGKGRGGERAKAGLAQLGSKKCVGAEAGAGRQLPKRKCRWARGSQSSHNNENTIC